MGGGRRRRIRGMARDSRAFSPCFAGDPEKRAARTSSLPFLRNLRLLLSSSSSSNSSPSRPTLFLSSSLPRRPPPPPPASRRAPRSSSAPTRGPRTSRPPRARRRSASSARRPSSASARSGRARSPSGNSRRTTIVPGRDGLPMPFMKPSAVSSRRTRRRARVVAGVLAAASALAVLVRRARRRHRREGPGAFGGTRVALEGPALPRALRRRRDARLHDRVAEDRRRRDDAQDLARDLDGRRAGAPDRPHRVLERLRLEVLPRARPLRDLGGRARLPAASLREARARGAL